MSSSCQIHNLNHVTWVMCPLCFATLLSILGTYCSQTQINQILAILLGNGNECQQEDTDTSEQQLNASVQTEQEELESLATTETAETLSESSEHSMHGEELKEDEFLPEEQSATSENDIDMARFPTLEEMMDYCETGEYPEWFKLRRTYALQ